MKKYLVVSDLHIFRYPENMASAQNIFKQLDSGRYDGIIYNGDTYEVVFGQHLHEPAADLNAAQNKAAEAALHDLWMLLEKYPDIEHHFLLGNHEDHSAFKKGLAQLAEQKQHFHYHEHHFKLGDALFLHGDAPLGKGPIGKNSSRLSLETIRAAERFTRLTDHAAFHVHHHLMGKNGKLFSEKTLSHLKSNHPELLQDTAYIFTGHTHIPYVHEHEGRVFVNTGTTSHPHEKQCGFMEIELDEDSQKLTGMKNIGSGELYRVGKPHTGVSR